MAVVKGGKLRQVMAECEKAMLAFWFQREGDGRKSSLDGIGSTQVSRVPSHSSPTLFVHLGGPNSHESWWGGRKAVGP